MQSVSVIIPSLNNADTISETLRSCLDEPEVGEVIVVLAPSTDGTAEIVKGFGNSRITLLEPGVRGTPRQMNIGIAHARFEYMCKIDADDLVAKGRFQKQAKFLRENHDYVAIAGGLMSIDMTGRVLCDPVIRYSAGDVTDLYLNACEVAHLGTLLIRTQRVKEIGGFREWFIMSQDYDLSFRLAECGKIWLSEDPAYAFRVRPNSITHSKPKILSDFYAEAARKFCRQRALSGCDDLGRGAPPPLPAIDDEESSRPFDPQVRLSNYLEVGAWKDFNRGAKKAGILKMLESIKESSGSMRWKRIQRLFKMIGKAAMEKIQ